MTGAAGAGLVTPTELRARFALGLSRLYGTEVPAYATLVEVCEEVNADVMARGDDAERLGTIDRVTAERHGAIRLGTPHEIAQVARIFGACGMYPVGFYDLREATPAIPVISTAFRPIDRGELAKNPFRVFTSLLVVDDRRFFEASLEAELREFLQARTLFPDELMSLADLAEAHGGLGADDADRFLRLAVEAFALSPEPVDREWYERLEQISSVAADIGGVTSTHINHLTPRVLDIDELYRRMGERGIEMIDRIQGPPATTKPDVLLRQTSFRALAEPRTFRESDGSLATGDLRVRFGEVEARGVALTPRGRELYDAHGLDAFPDTDAELFEQDLAYYVRDAAGRLTPIVYEDFLPRSAAGIFASNLTSGGSLDASQRGSARDAAWLQSVLGRALHDPYALYDAERGWIFGPYQWCNRWLRVRIYIRPGRRRGTIMRTGWVWHERFGWYDTGRWSGWVGPGGWGEPILHMENSETKRRLASLVSGSGLVDHLTTLTPRLATDEELLAVHTPAYLDYLREQDLDPRGGFADPDVKVTPFAQGDLEIARLAAGGVVVAAEAVASGQVTNAYALTRPPGHHATAAAGFGFCVFANIAIAIQRVRQLAGIAKVAVVDWDVHHGNGTQDIFWDDPDVLTISLHQDRLFPASSGLVSETGGPGAEGACINVPLPPGSGHEAYLHAFDEVVEPAIDRFEPDLVFVASGYDSSVYDPNGRMLLHSDSYRAMTARMMTLAAKHCDDRLVVVHEGGYSAFYVPYCGLAVVETLSGVSTGVEDLRGIGPRSNPMQALFPHQAEAVAEAAAAAHLTPR